VQEDPNPLQLPTHTQAGPRICVGPILSPICKSYDPEAILRGQRQCPLASDRFPGNTQGPASSLSDIHFPVVSSRCESFLCQHKNVGIKSLLVAGQVSDGASIFHTLPIVRDFQSGVSCVSIQGDIHCNDQVTP